MTRTALLLVLATASLAQIPKLDGRQAAKVARGEVVVVPLEPTDGSGVTAWAAALVNAPVEKVWPVVRDCAHFSRFMPRTKVSRLLRQDGNTLDCMVEISMPFPISNLWSHVRSTLKELPGGGHERRWRLLKGTYKRNNGAWIVQPWEGDASRSLLLYQIDVNPDIFVPDAIIRSAQTGSLPDVFEAVRKRAGAN